MGGGECDRGNGQREEGSGNFFLWLFWSSSKCLGVEGVSKPELRQEGSRESDCLLLPGSSSLLSLAFQESMVLDVCQEEFERTADLG